MVVEVAIQFYKVKYRNQESDHDFNDTICSILLGSLQEVFHFFMKPMFYIPYLYVWNNFRILNPSSSSWLSFILGFLGIDFSIYCFHRMGHEINLFWAIHVPHHSSEHYNFSSATRQSMFQYLSAWLHYLPMAFFVHPVHYSYHHHWNRIVQFWLHSKLFCGYFKWIECIFITPSIHMVHHSKNPQYIDKNYGGVLVIWDKLFGTFKQEDPGVEPEFGITEEVDTHSTIWLNIHHFILMYNLSKRLKGFAKLKVIYKSPSWVPEDDYSPDQLNPISDNDCNNNNNNNSNNIESSKKIQIESKKNKINDVFGTLMCCYLLMEALSISIVLSSLETFKFVFTDNDIYKVGIIITFQIAFVGSILSKNNSDPVIVLKRQKCGENNTLINSVDDNNNINSNNASEQQGKLKISFLESYPWLSLIQMLRMVITVVFFYDISTTNIVGEVQFFFGFLFKFTSIQIVSWIVAVIFSHHKNIVISSQIPTNIVANHTKNINHSIHNINTKKRNLIKSKNIKNE